MKVELGKIGSITHGVVLNRVKSTSHDEAVLFPLLTISRLLQEEEGLAPEQDIKFPVSKNKVSNLRLAKAGMIVIGLTSFHKAAVLTAEHEGMIISSNFLILEFPGGIMDPHYFAWYFNEHPDMKRMRETVINGEGKVKVLSIRLIRELKISVPDLVMQMSIGNLYALQVEKERLWKEKLRLEKDILSVHMTKITAANMENQETLEKMGKRQCVIDEKLSEIEQKKNIYEDELKLFATFK